MPNRKLAIWLFLASECMFFGALMATYLIYQGQSLVGPYPEDLRDIHLTTASTFILMMSGLAMVLRVSAAPRADLNQTGPRPAVAALLGVTFLGFPPYEYNHFIHAALTLSVTLFGTTFYVMTGFHGAHVAIGVIWLSSLLAHTFRPVDPKRRALDIEIAGLYWHFVDIVWI